MKKTILILKNIHSEVLNQLTLLFMYDDIMIYRKHLNSMRKHLLISLFLLGLLAVFPTANAATVQLARNKIGKAPREEISVTVQKSNIEQIKVLVEDLNGLLEKIDEEGSKPVKLAEKEKCNTETQIQKPQVLVLEKNEDQQSNDKSHLIKLTKVDKPVIKEAEENKEKSEQNEALETTAAHDHVELTTMLEKSKTREEKKQEHPLLSTSWTANPKNKRAEPKSEEKKHERHISKYVDNNVHEQTGNPSEQQVQVRPMNRLQTTRDIPRNRNIQNRGKIQNEVKSSENRFEPRAFGPAVVSFRRPSTRGEEKSSEKNEKRSESKSTESKSQDSSSVEILPPVVGEPPVAQEPPLISDTDPEVVGQPLEPQIVTDTEPEVVTEVPLPPISDDEPEVIGQSPLPPISHDEPEIIGQTPLPVISDNEPEIMGDTEPQLTSDIYPEPTTYAQTPLISDTEPELYNSFEPQYFNYGEVQFEPVPVVSTSINLSNDSI